LLCELQEQLGDELKLKSERAFAIRWGSAELIEQVRAGVGVKEMEALWESALREFTVARAKALLY
jgi:hypothetical protein